MAVELVAPERPAPRTKPRAADASSLDERCVVPPVHFARVLPTFCGIGNSIKELTLPLSSNTVTQGIIQS